MSNWIVVVAYVIIPPPSSSCSSIPSYRSRMSAIESYLPEVGSPLFDVSVEEVVSIWEANPNASYEAVLFNYMVNHFLMSAPEDEWYEQTPVTVSSSVDEKVSFFVPNTVSDKVSAFIAAKFPHQRVDKCSGGNRCSDATCQLFHGPLCGHHFRLPYAEGKLKGRIMPPCTKGLACGFDHASAEMRKARVDAGIQQKRIQFAPSLRTEADILAVFPSIEWRFSDVYTYGGLSGADMDLLEVCLDRSPELDIVALGGGLLIKTCDFQDSRDLPVPPPFVMPAPRADDAGGWQSAPSRRR